ncbi:MAG: hypothetical protein GKS06_08005 [Acidobacteria bacterium]|nr:hypothetical protein [Acidobacteriota bacterium]
MSRTLRTGAVLAIALVAPVAAFAQEETAALEEVDARIIWVGTVERGSVVQQVRGPGTMERFGRGFHAHVRVMANHAAALQLDQEATVDTRSEKLVGRVVHIDDRIEEGTLRVIVEVTDAIPDSVRPGLSIDARIRTGVLENVVYVDRPAYGQTGQTIGIFKLTSDGSIAERIPVTFGASSVDKIVVADGLMPGDQIILSDMSRYDASHKVRLIQ